MKHELKIKPEYFAAVVNGEKTFEIRNNDDRNFQVGDTLVLKSFDGEFNGNFVERTISYITNFEQKPGYVVLGMANKREQELAEQLADATRQCGVMAGLLREVIVRDDFDRDDGESAGRLLYRIDSAIAGKLSVPAVTVTETILTAPAHIWLQVGDQTGDSDYPFPEFHDEVSWCADSVVACEVPYVRADLVGNPECTVCRGTGVFDLTGTYCKKCGGAA
ncbi:ASCH/PUA domain-containing protein [Aeromonas caviae]|uniref:ASCH/PUA domain-containing protein n=1 Tax=Aeromonas caviae TaxID=648 RepID=UPI0030154BB1